jgi:hypothetical protein
MRNSPRISSRSNALMRISSIRSVLQSLEFIGPYQMYQIFNSLAYSKAASGARSQSHLSLNSNGLFKPSAPHALRVYRGRIISGRGYFVFEETSIRKHHYSQSLRQHISCFWWGFLCTYGHFDLNYMIGKDIVHLMNNWIPEIHTVMCLAWGLTVSWDFFSDRFSSEHSYRDLYWHPHSSRQIPRQQDTDCRWEWDNLVWVTVLT